MMSKKGIVALFAVMAFAVVVLAPAIADDSDADITVTDKSYKFDNKDGGEIKFNAYSDSNSDIPVKIEVQEKSGKIVGSKSDTLHKGNNSVTVSMPNYKSVGSHTLYVFINYENGTSITSFTIDVEVEKNILSNPLTYVVIAIVVIVIAIIIYMKVRDSPKKEQSMTFEQLEQQRKEEMAAKGEKKKATKEAKAPKSERQRYLESKKK